MKQNASGIIDPRRFAAFANAGGPLPGVGPMRASFWAGYNGQSGVRMGITGSVERRAFDAGRKRALVERCLRQN
jgi:hypothetical protein